ncbi:hypothetical protein BRADI_3g57225v3 [Brachypodium distachyon]|uniref:Uncharacterized protein n=1 Tax=Brachypodium distachyon TaxID=15368 RepID=A0A0Q3MBE8_BRADI|nr:hypothetical protein BRADI_3g57225v3 [Brachypodium distachyon]
MASGDKGISERGKGVELWRRGRGAKPEPEKRGWRGCGVGPSWMGHVLGLHVLGWSAGLTLARHFVSVQDGVAVGSREHHEATVPHKSPDRPTGSPAPGATSPGGWLRCCSDPLVARFRCFRTRSLGTHRTRSSPMVFWSQKSSLAQKPMWDKARASGTAELADAPTARKCVLCKTMFVAWNFQLKKLRSG